MGLLTLKEGKSGKGSKVDGPEDILPRETGPSQWPVLGDSIVWGPRSGQSQQQAARQGLGQRTELSLGRWKNSVGGRR